MMEDYDINWLTNLGLKLGEHYGERTSDVRKWAVLDRTGEECGILLYGEQGIVLVIDQDHDLIRLRREEALKLFSSCDVVPDLPVGP